MNNNLCPTCGATILEGNRYCIECGTAIEQSDMQTPVQPAAENQSQPVFDYPVYQQVTDNQSSYGQEQSSQTSYQQGQQQQNTYQQYSYQQQPKNDSVPGEDSPYQPISVWGYVGIMLLMCVPCVGFIFLIVWACGGCRKVNKKNYARAALIVAAISLVFSLVFGVIFGTIITTALKAVSLDSIMESEDGEAGLDLDILEALNGLDNGDFSVLEDLSDEELETLSEITGVDYTGLKVITDEDGNTILGLDNDYGDDYYDEYYDEYYDDEYYEDEYYEDEYYEDEYYESDYDGWPEDYLPAYPSGEGEYVTAICTAFDGTSAEEMKSYVNTLKDGGFWFDDFYDYGIAEEDALEMDAWMGTDGYMYVIMFYADGTLYIDHSTELTDLEY